MREIWSRPVVDAPPRPVVRPWAAFVVAVVTVIGLGVSLAVPAQASLAVAVPPAAPDPVVAKSDLASALVAAEAQKHPVEIVDARTESSTTWALPDGQLRKDLNPAPVRVEAANGSWAPIDLTLVAGKNGWVPRSSPRPVTFSAGGSGPAVLFTRRGRSLSMGWKSALPAPVIAGPTATYALDETRDLVLTARLDGFEQSVVIKDRPSAGGSVPEVVLPLTLTGTDAVTVPGGGIAFEATRTTGTGEAKVKAGAKVFAIQAPVMYSAATDATTGEHTQVAELPQKLVQDPKAGVDAGLTLTPDAKFLRDPATVFPVTVDPVISAVDAIGDTWVRNGDDAVHGAEDEINAGIWGESWQNSSALIKFDDAQFLWNHVTSASLNLFNSYSGSCEPNWVGVYPVSQDWDPATVVYQTSPDIIDDDHQLWRQFSHGFDASCPGASESFDVSSTVEAWGWGDLPNYGFAIYADTNGTDGRKAFCSLDVGTSGACSDPGRVPTLSVTYNSYPWDPDEVVASPQATGPNGETYVTSLTPVLQAWVGNTDGANVALEGEISYDPDNPEDGDGVFWSGIGTPSTPEAPTSVTVDTAMTAGSHYRYRVRGTIINGAGDIETGQWSDYTYFTVDPDQQADEGTDTGGAPAADETPDTEVTPDPSETPDADEVVDIGEAAADEADASQIISAMSAGCGCQIDIKQRDYIRKKYYEGESGDIAEEIVVDRAWTQLAKAIGDLKTCHNLAVAAGQPGCYLYKVVPFPVMKRNRKNDKKYYYVYRITAMRASNASGKYTYKYGIGTYGTNRVDVSRNKCKRARAASGETCTSKFMVKKVKGWTNARTIEASYILQYAVKHGRCPLGQPSCL